MKSELFLKVLELVLQSDLFKDVKEDFYAMIREFAKKSSNDWDDKLAEFLIQALDNLVDNFDGEA